MLLSCGNAIWIVQVHHNDRAQPKHTLCQKEANYPRQRRWAERIQSSVYQWQYRPGTCDVVDLISRPPHFCEDDDAPAAFVSSVSAVYAALVIPYQLTAICSTLDLQTALQSLVMLLQR